MQANRARLSIALGLVLSAIVVSVIPLAIEARAIGEVPLCPMRWGEPAKPLVSKSDTAKSIFLAVEADFFPMADRTGFPNIAIEDDGKFWSVGRSKAPGETANGDIEITYGGGQLTLRIAKCDGRISDVAFSR